MASNPPHDHPFVPVFYLKNWVVAPEQRLAEYRRKKEHVIRPRWTGARSTDYERHLYEADDKSVESLETSSMMPADARLD